MGKLIGMVFILAGCGGILVSWCKKQRMRQAVIRELIRLLSRWEYSMEREKVRLFDFLEQYRAGEPLVREFLSEVLEKLRTRDCPSGAKVWGMSLSIMRGMIDFGEDVWDAVLSADGAFFGNSRQESLQCARVCRRRLEECLKQETLEFARRRKVYMPVGMLGGVLLIILFI